MTPNANAYSRSMSTPQSKKGATPTPATKTSTHTLSLWSMITGIAGLAIGWLVWLPWSVAAVVLGHIGLSQAKKNKSDEGRSYAITGLITGYVGIFVFIIFAFFVALFFVGIFMGSAGSFFTNGMMHGYGNDGLMYP